MGLLITLLTGFLQDPLRKLSETEPVLLTGLVAGTFAVTLGSAVLRRGLPRPNKIYGWRDGLSMPVMAFVLIVCVQVVHTAVRTGNPILAVIGLLGYLSPLPAAWVAYRLGRDSGGIRVAISCYVVLVVLISTGVYLSFFGYDWSVLRQVGQGLRVFSQGRLLEVHPGFWRSPEVAAWHAAAGICFLVMLWTMAKRWTTRPLIVGLMLYLIGAGLLAGRRKMLVEVVVFAVGYWALLAYYRHGATRVAALAMVAGVLGAPIAIEILEGSVGRLDPYVRHGVSGFRDAPQRFEMLGLGSVQWAIHQHGLLGVGAGSGIQGAQHFGGGTSLVGGTTEGGLGRVMTELGLPGLLALGWLAVALARLIWRSLARPAGGEGFETARYGLAAFLAANLVAFVVASQVYGDLFVLLILGWTVGMLIGSLAPRWSVRTLDVLGHRLHALDAERAEILTLRDARFYRGHR
jgi:hypothetical protein